MGEDRHFGIASETPAFSRCLTTNAVLNVPAMTSTCQPIAFNFAAFLLSRSTFADSFGPQKSCLLLGLYANLHPACLCQKQPCTKIASLYRERTRSGFPGRPR